MACGTPVVGTDVGGVREVVDDQRTGFLVDPEDLDGFAARLRELLMDREKSKLMGQQARERAVERFARDKIIGQYEAMYARVLERPSR